MFEPVISSPDFIRVDALPRREVDLLDASRAQYWTTVLRLPDTSPCSCRQVFGHCINALNPIQGWALDEARKSKGLLGLIGVGCGKTALDILLPLVIPDCKVAVLFLPPALKHQFLKKDFPHWSRHFYTPTLAGYGKRFTPGRPLLHVIGYSELSIARGAEMLEEIKPDLIICDEAHNLKHRKSTRTKRFMRYLAKHDCRVVALSGTLTNKSIRDYAHLGVACLDEGAPVPIHYPTIEEWAGALDPADFHTPPKSPGVLKKWCAPGEKVREGYRRRLVSTPGVVATDARKLGCSLILHDAPAPSIPEVVKSAIHKVESTWTRPDGEELESAMEVAAVLKQISCGFYYQWTWPRGETQDVIDRWMHVRALYRKEVREELKHSPAGMDSPLLLYNAARRYYSKDCPDGPVWRSGMWPEWEAIKDTAKPETSPVWLSDFLTDDLEHWCSERTIIWYEHSAFGERAAKLLGLPHYGAGDVAAQEIVRETGGHAIIASIKAHGTGRNLQFAFSQNVIVSCPSGADVWEQLLGRTHRELQPEDEVHATVYQHTQTMRDAFESALEKARYIQETTGNPQRLLYANKTFE